MRSRAQALLLVLLIGSAANPGRAAEAAEPPLLVVLTPAGGARDGLPLLAVHPESERIAASLDRGIVAEMIRVYRFLQIGSRAGIEPAYLLLSDQDGGFPRYGFWLRDEKKPGTPYIDIKRSWPLHGRFGAIDQIFPHELAHAILHQLGVEPPATAGANQVHAVGVRTDRHVAFDEGFAEHLQVMAVDHAGAAPETRALAHARELDEAAGRHLRQYRNELTARIPSVGRMRIGFPLWYSNDERTLRYFAVKRNAFVREPEVPQRLLESSDLYPAYLLESVAPADPSRPLRRASQLFAIEGAMSTLFWRWATDPTLQGTFREPEFYQQYGTSAEELSPLQNVYLKIFHVIALRKTADARTFVQEYGTLFPDEAPAVAAILANVFPGQRLDLPPEIWLASEHFATGTTLFDQFRGAPRPHTFDLNAASLVDLMTIPGMDFPLALRIQKASPFSSLDDLARVERLDEEVRGNLTRMAARMDAFRKSPGPDSVEFRPVLLPYVWWGTGVLLLCVAAASTIYAFGRKRLKRPAGILRTIAAGLGAGVVAALLSWITGNPLVALAGVAGLFGIPAAGWLLVRRQGVVQALAVLALWIATALPAIAITTSWF